MVYSLGDGIKVRGTLEKACSSPQINLTHTQYPIAGTPTFKGSHSATAVSKYASQQRPTKSTTNLRECLTRTLGYYPRESIR